MEATLAPLENKAQTPIAEVIGQRGVAAALETTDDHGSIRIAASSTSGISQADGAGDRRGKYESVITPASHSTGYIITRKSRGKTANGRTES